MKKLTFGVGYNSKGVYPATVNGKQVTAYKKWRAVMGRCYSKDLHAIRPTYTDCVVAEDWHDYQRFAKWYEENKPIDNSYHLDKDILKRGNRVYGPETCCFVPIQLNQLFVTSKSRQGCLPQGVYFDKKSKDYVAQMRANGKTLYLGGLKCPKEAYQVYKTAKERYVKNKALEWANRIEWNVFVALMNWTLED